VIGRPLALLVVWLAFAGPAHAAVYYVSPGGSDGASGLAGNPWRTVARVDAAHLRPGDSVLFAGGATFADATLSPGASGTRQAPITFGSYGTGRANIARGIALASAGWLVLDGVEVDTGDWRTAATAHGFATAQRGSGVHDVVVRSSRFANVAIGVLLANHLDANLRFENDVIEQTRDSGILVFDPTQPRELGGHDLTFQDDRILDTGLDPAITWQKHGAYVVGSRTTWRGNTIRGFDSCGPSLRAHAAIVVGNTIDGPDPVCFVPYDAAPGTSVVAYNRLTASRLGVEVYDGTGGLVPQRESVVVASNTITGTGAGVRLYGTAGSLSLANNVVATAGLPLQLDSRPGGGLVETHDLLYRVGGPLSLGYRGVSYATLDAFRAATGQGAGDLTAPPDPAALVDAGTTAVAGVRYSPGCGGAPFQYCGAAPDLGAAEDAAGPCGTRKRTTYRHVLWVVMENHASDQVIGSGQAPYMTRLAGACGLATAYTAIAHPSLPNYIALTSGDTWGITDDDSPPAHELTAASIFEQVTASGRQWRTFAEGSPGGCPSANKDRYAVRHDPATYYTRIRADCARWDLPLTALNPDRLPAFTFVVPDLCHDMHDCDVSTGDTWLQGFLARVLAGASYRSGSTAVFVTFDEDDRHHGNTVATLVVSPTTPRGTTSATPFTHYSLLKTTEQLLGLPFLAHAREARSMRSAFRL
jgi:hypothetical protein